MTQHPSLREGQGSGKFRSVLKRYEKIKELVEKEKWREEKDSIYHLPKVKRIKFKVKKVKEEAPLEGELAPAALVAPGAPGTAAKPQEAGAKPAGAGKAPGAAGATPAAQAPSKEKKLEKGKK